ncbi:MAG TPA: NADH-quinone oxidoreductase subunit N [Gemmatimonadaceae bacterium]|nr:NADH-quinone oxidoreductase subunit N [Gemmatimonadaceae bacterium]
MSGADWVALLPLIFVGGMAVLVMVVIAVHRDHRLTLALTLIGLALAFASLWPAAAHIPRRVTPLLIVDRYALFYLGLIIAAAFAVALLSYGYFEKCEGKHDEMYVLLLLGTLGSEVLVESTHFVSFFLGLEILSVSLYGLTAYLRTRRLPLEAGIKYLVLAASSAAFLLFGVALVYAELGTMRFAEIASRLAAQPAASRVVLIAATALIITGIGFKLGVVPFHLWTPDVYEGAPAPVTAFIATVSKASMFAFLIRYFSQPGWEHTRQLYAVFAIIAIASMLAGNLLALMQRNVKRILAYSSIAHFGYLLVAFLAGGLYAIQAVTFYLVAYIITTLGAFGIVAVLSDGTRDADQMEDYRGLFWRRPVLATIFTLMILSLAGIPLTAGFLGKFYIVAAGASASVWALIVILAVTSVIGLFYYLRIVVALFAEVPQGAESAGGARVSAPLLGGYTLVVLAILLVWFGVYPTGLITLIQTAARGLG